MRRVYDDTKCEFVKTKVMSHIWRMDKNDIADIVKYDYGCERVQVYLVKKKIAGWLGDDFKFGKNEHAHGIGNNNAIEVIYLGNKDEEQICALLHLTDDMFGSVYCWVSDIDEENKTESAFITDRGVRHR